MSSTAGAVSSVLMSLPLIAVPCLAVFGLPAIGPATAKADAEDAVELATIDDLGPATSSASAAPAFQPIVDAGEATPAAQPPASDAPPADRSQIDPTSDHRGAAANRALGLEVAGVKATEVPTAPPATSPENAFVIVDDAAETETPSQPEGPPAASWEGAVAKLNRLGARDFHLTNGEAPGRFYFNCRMAGAASNVTRFFEAEADSPVAAAEDVLGQVEQWLATR